MTTVTCYLIFRWYYGPEFSGKALDTWAFEHGVQIEFTRPGKPTDNGHIESFNGKFRDECLNQVPRRETWKSAFLTLLPDAS